MVFINEKNEIAKRVIDLVPTYYLKTDDKVYSRNMVDVLKQSNALTFNPHCGFDEVGILDIKIPEKYKWIKRLDLPPNNRDLDSICVDLFLTLKNYFEYTWDSNRIHLVSASGGADSRMLMWLLKTLEIQNGKDWLGDVRFICHDSAPNCNNHLSEGTIFLNAMKKMGWDDDIYKVHKVNTPDDPDYFDLGNTSRHPNAYYMCPPIWWDDVVNREEEKETVFVNGITAGLLLNYPKDLRKINWKIYTDFMTQARQHLAFYNNTFYAVSVPFIDYEYIGKCFLLPPSAFNFPGRLDLRTYLISKFNDTNDFYYSHEYNFKISDKRLSEMNDFYFNSKFYERFRVNIDIKNYRDYNTYIFDNTLKIYGLALIYKEAFG